MAETSAGGWVRSAPRSSASTRPWACASGAASAPKGEASRSTRASASATGINATARSPKARERPRRVAGSAILGPIAPRFAAALLDQANALDAHAALDRLHPVVDGEAGDRHRGEGLHLDTGLTGHMGGGAHDEAGQLAIRLNLHGDLGNREGMAQ